MSRYGINLLHCYEVYKVLTVVMYSSQLSNYQLLFFSFLLLTPRGCATASVGEYVSAFFPLGFWVFVSGSAHK